MGRPPSNGGPSFRFNPTEVAEMEGILQAHNCLVPQREILVALAEKFSNSAERSGRPPVQMKQVWNWFQNRRYALRAKSAKPPMKLNVSPMPQQDSAVARNLSQAPQHPSVAAATVRNVPQGSQPVPTASPTVQSVGRNGTDNSQMEFEAKSARDGAWYDVASFLSHRSLETNDPKSKLLGSGSPWLDVFFGIFSAHFICSTQFHRHYTEEGGKEVLVRFAGFGPEEDEWVNVRKHVRQRSLPCESSECVAVLPGDLILCFQEGKEQALYFDAHVLDAQRRRHDVRGCRCRFLVRYDHDQSEEIVPLRKVCRRPETDYRMQQLHADSANMKQNKTSPEHHKANNVKAYTAAEVTLKQPKVDGPAETIPKPANAEVPADSGPIPIPVSNANISVTTSMAPTADSGEPLASATIPSPHSAVSLAPTLAPDPDSRVPGTTIPAAVASNTPVSPTAAPIANSSDTGVTVVAPVASSVPSAPAVDPGANSSVPDATFMTSTASSIHAAPAGEPVPDSSVPIVPTTPPVANSSVPMDPADSCIPGATVVDPVASHILVAPATAPVASPSSPIVPTTAPAPDASVSVPETSSPCSYSSAPAVSDTVPTANSSVPVAPPAAVDANSIVPMDVTTNPSSHVAPTVAPSADSSAPAASNAEAPVANSSFPVAMITEAPAAANSNVPEAPVASNVPPVTEFNNVLVEKVSESGSADNVDNTNVQSANLASGTDSSAVLEEEPVESMQLG